MSDLFLGLIALGVMVMATLQVVALLAVVKAAKSVGELAGRFQQDVQPILANLQKVSAEAARASAQAADQVDRLDRLVSSVAERVEETAATLQETILQPARDALGFLQVLRTVVAGFRDSWGSREPAARREEAPVHPTKGAPDDDELFIG